MEMDVGAAKPEQNESRRRLIEVHARSKRAFRERIFP